MPVANKPVLFYGLEAIRDAGVTEVGIIVGETAAEIEAAVGDGSELGLQVTYLRQEAPLGLAHCVLIARDFLGDDDFVMYLGDNFLIGGITELVGEFQQHGFEAQILLTKVPNPEQFGVAELGAGRPGQVAGGEAEGSGQRPCPGRRLHVHAGDPRGGRAIQPSARGELEITDAIQYLIDAGHNVQPHLVSGYWKDTGRLEDMLECNRKVLETLEPSNEGTVDDVSSIVGRVVLQEGASVVRSTVRGPAIIGRGTKIVDAYIGPFTSIYHGCVVADAEIEHSIVLEETVIRGVGRIEDSLIGKQVEVTTGTAQPKALRLMLGDHSKVTVP